MAPSTTHQDAPATEDARSITVVILADAVFAILFNNVGIQLL